jgi:protein ImuA
MDKAAHPLDLPSALPRPAPHVDSDESVSLSGETRFVASLSPRVPPRRSSALSVAAPASPAGARETLETLRQRILAIERPKLEIRQGIGEERDARAGRAGLGAGPRMAAWSLGAPEIDALMGANALDTAACHELKPQSAKAASRAAALAFALALAKRRLDGAARAGRDLPRILWCMSPRTMLDTGALYPPGLARFGLNASSFLFIDGRREDDVLWALEEGLRSGSLALAVGALSSIGLTPARRLSLAARDGATPLLLLTSARSSPSAATATRWRIDPAASGAHPFDPRAPGLQRLAVRLERCRSAPPATEAAMILEWSHEASRFRVAAAVADRTVETAPARRRAG